ncbi:MAG: hypothetical protein H7Y38_05630 [Armatimonadetes bacterium]|nr:hypothetical protein [Armatimonadota bacterium]
MHTPLLRRYFPADPDTGAAERFLDKEYQLERIAATELSDEPFVEYLQFSHESDRVIAEERLKTLIGKSKAGTAPALYAVLTAPKPAGTPRFAPADTVAQSLAERLARLRTRGTQIEQVLTNPTFAGGESQLLIEAARALKNGMMSTGRDQTEEFKDALGLFREAQAGAIGARNYVVWFQIGWILWKTGESLAEAEEAFYQAYRLSAATQDIFYYSSQRHRAYLQFLQNNPTEAYDTIARAVRLYPQDPDVLRDAARYAVVSGKTGEGNAYLRELLTLDPAQAETVFAEEVFAAALPTVADGVWQTFESGEREAAHAVHRLVHAEMNGRESAERSGVAVELSPEMLAGVSDAQALINLNANALSFPVAKGVTQTATAQTAAIYTYIRQTLETATTETEQRLIRPRRQIERLVSDQKRWKEDVMKLERAARQSKINIASPPRRGLFVKFNAEHASLYENYQTARGQADMNAKKIAEEMPGYETEIAQGEAEQAKIAETLVWLAKEQEAKPVAGAI